ncbi:hypothetical protein JJD41_12540 [Oxynema sp. CENA135]|uniref:hypothetical protein n=1 Tax=Oxynema sp. CENA135 TaxID=984206 RepID=UPI00190C5D68|nr:hypothetical protein [Oxynema sp. CENA135]MBK4730686.1 hypothetical protein [Oxynema sp. CENA135]
MNICQGSSQPQRRREPGEGGAIAPPSPIFIGRVPGGEGRSHRGTPTPARI